MKPNQQFENVFGPMPASFERRIQQALRHTKEEKPVKKFSIQTAALVCTMLCCLIAVCTALTQQPEDKVAGAPDVTPVTRELQPLSDGEDIAWVMAEEYEKIDPNAVSWLLTGSTTIDEKVYYQAERLVHTADAIYIISNMSPHWPGQSVVVDREWINETVTYNGQEMSFLDYVNQGNYAFEVSCFANGVYDMKDHRGDEGASVSVHYGLRDEKGSIPVVIKMAGQFDAQTLKESEVVIYIAQTTYGALPNEYAYMDLDNVYWHLSLAPVATAQEDKGNVNKVMLGKATLREATESLQVNASAVFEGIEFRMEQIVCAEENTYLLSGLYPMDDKTIILKGDVNTTVFVNGQEATCADLLTQGYTAYRVGYRDDEAPVKLYNEEQYMGFGNTMRYAMSGREELWMDGAIAAVFTGNSRISLETAKNYTVEQLIWMAKCGPDGNVKETDKQYYTWRVDLSSGKTEIIPVAKPENTERSIEDIARIVMQDAHPSYVPPNYADMELTSWEVDQPFWLTETVYFGLERVVHGEDVFFVKGRFGTTKPGDLLLTNTTVGEIVTADMVDHGYGLHEVQAYVHELRLSDGSAFTPSSAMHDEWADWSDSIGVVFVFEQAIDKQLLQEATIELKLEYASFDADYSRLLMDETVSLKPDADEAIAVPEVMPVRHNKISTDVHIAYIINGNPQKRAQTALAGDYFALGSGLKVWPVKDEEITHGVLKYKIDTVVYTPQDFFVIGTVEAAQGGKGLNVHGGGIYSVVPNINRTYFSSLRRLSLFSEDERDLTSGNLCGTAIAWDDNEPRFVVSVYLSGTTLEAIQSGTLRLLIKQEIDVGDELHERDFVQWDVDLSPDY